MACVEKGHWEIACALNKSFMMKRWREKQSGGPRGARLKRPVPLQLCGRPLPWVERAEHLGHALHQDGTMTQDTLEKRAQFIDTSVKIRESFHFAHPAYFFMFVMKSTFWTHQPVLNKQAERFLSAFQQRAYQAAIRHQRATLDFGF